MMSEARRRNLHEDEAVLNAVQAWERNRLVSTLIELEMGDDMSWTEQELSAFYEDMGAGSEIRLQRIDVADRQKAVGFLEQIRDGLPILARCIKSCRSSNEGREFASLFGEKI